MKRIDYTTRCSRRAGSGARTAALLATALTLACAAAQPPPPSQARPVPGAAPAQPLEAVPAPAPAPAVGEPAGAARPAVGPAPLPVVQDPARETEAQTVAKCLPDLDAANVEARRRAAAVLGKYPGNPTALAAVIRCLDDPDAQVRQSALVALTEGDLVPFQARDAIFRRFADPDVHIRRIATATLRDMLPGFAFGRIGAMPGPLPLPAAGARLSPENVRLVNDALGDADPTVRKNILASGSALADVLEPKRLLHCIDDPAADIRLLALMAIRTRLNPEDELPEVVTARVADPDPRLRRELAGVLGERGAQAEASLRRLGEDKDPAVRAAAVRELVQLRAEGGFALLERLLRDEAVAPEERGELLPALAFYPEPAPRLLRDLIQSGPPALRPDSVLLLAALDRTAPPVFFIDLTESPAAELRRAALDVLLRRPVPLEPGDVARLLASRHADVRRDAFRLVVRLPPAQADGLARDCLLDEDVRLRCDAIRFIALRGLPGWTTVLAQSLRDPAADVRLAAADALLRRGAEGRAVLDQHLRDVQDPELEQHVRNRAAQPVPAATPVLPPPGRQRPVPGAPTPAPPTPRSVPPARP